MIKSFSSKGISTVLFLFLIFSLKAQDFYDLETVQTIEITFSESNWDELLDAEKAGDENYIMAETVVINDITFDSVGVKYKGNSTYNANQTKNPFHIELDTYKEQDYDGYKDIKLSNVANDPSFVREVLSYQILRQYMDAPLSNYANVYVNGTLMGLYSNSEAISKTFVGDRFGSKNNTFVKCNPPAGAGPNTSDYPNLVYMGTDSSDYYDSYEIKSDDGWKELIDLTDTLANDIDAIEEILDVDRALWMLAFDNVLVNLDSYIGGFAQNYYLYRDDNGRFLPIVWDLNESFGRFTQTGTNVTLSSTADKQQMTHLLHENDADYPLVQKLLSIPMYKRMYLAHYKTILLENFDDDSYYTTAQELQTTIDADVLADNNKFFTYQNFLDNLSSDIITGDGRRTTTTNGITSLMDGRNDYLLAQTDFTNVEPEISNITLSDDLPVVNSSITITAEIANANTAYLGYREDGEDRFIRYQMYDDGAHGDESAGDGIFGVTITVLDSYSQYFIYAENDNIGFFSPRRAEHEYHVINATISNTTAGDLVINEFMASNDLTVSDQDGEFDDWIEIHNNSDQEISLDGYYLSDNSGDLFQWSFPANTTIEANGYLIVWADKDELQTGYHANFKLSASNEAIFFVNSTGQIIDEISFSDQETDSSFARMPNGIGDFEVSEPTFNDTNDLISGIFGVTTSLGLSAYPNPSNGSFTLSVDQESVSEEKVMIYDYMGRIVFDDAVESELFINTSNWESGIYIIKVGDSSLKITVD